MNVSMPSSNCLQNISGWLRKMILSISSAIVAVRASFVHLMECAAEAEFDLRESLFGDYWIRRLSCRRCQRKPVTAPIIVATRTALV